MKKKLYNLILAIALTVLPLNFAYSQCPVNNPTAGSLSAAMLDDCGWDELNKTKTISITGYVNDADLKIISDWLRSKKGTSESNFKTGNTFDMSAAVYVGASPGSTIAVDSLSENQFQSINTGNYKITSMGTLIIPNNIKIISNGDFNYSILPIVGNGVTAIKGTFAYGSCFNWQNFIMYSTSGYKYDLATARLYTGTTLDFSTMFPNLQDVIKALPFADSHYATEALFTDIILPASFVRYVDNWLRYINKSLTSLTLKNPTPVGIYSQGVAFASKPTLYVPAGSEQVYACHVGNGTQTYGAMFNGVPECLSSGIDEEKVNSSVVVTVSNNDLIVKNLEGKNSIIVNSLQGSKVLQVVTSESSITLPLNIANGLYIVTVVDQSGNRVSRKIVK